MELALARIHTPVATAIIAVVTVTVVVVPARECQARFRMFLLTTITLDYVSWMHRSPGFRSSPSPAPVYVGILPDTIAILTPSHSSAYRVIILVPVQIPTLVIITTVNTTATSHRPLKAMVIRAPTLTSTSTAGIGVTT